MGPRRIGKTVLLLQLVQWLLDDGFPSGRIFYLSLDTPMYHGAPLEKLLNLYCTQKGCGPNERSIVIFDEIQYLKDWEAHLKSLTDRYPEFRFIASGSAAAALELKSQESGAGRFTDFNLPPLAFSEFLCFRNLEGELMQSDSKRPGRYKTVDIDRLNTHFLDYLNIGGYPEMVLHPQSHTSVVRHLRQDVVDKVLLRDLPSLYGIHDVQEMNRLLTFVAYHSGKEVSLNNLAEGSGVSKNTIQKYLEYLEAAFLIMRVRRVDDSGKTFQRATAFKICLTNPTLRSALFAPLAPDDPAMGSMVETAIFSQWLHAPQMRYLHYARWGRDGREVDIVALNPTTLKPKRAYEIKWSDKYAGCASRLSALFAFAEKNGLQKVGISSKTRTINEKVKDIAVQHFPCALHCYELGRRMLHDQTL